MIHIHIQQTVESLFKTFDKDGDGCLNRDETWALIREGLSKALPKYRYLTDQQINVFLDTIDTNKDGKIQKSELYDHFAKFY
jgi:Ca2+-binding EF-hand superfamily protein